MNAKDTERFWSKVDRTGDCWVWTGKISHGEGQFVIRSNGQSIHLRPRRLMYTLAYGQIPSGHIVYPICGTPGCIRLDHLRAGSPSPIDNPDRFWLKVDKSGDCWLWMGQRSEDGYGYVVAENREKTTFRATHLAYKFTYGPFPAGLWVLHRCDNPPCVRPDHLLLGTRHENIADMVAKRRQRKGAAINTAKLTPEQVIEIRRRFIPRVVTRKQLAAEYGVSPETIGDVVRGEHWKDT